MAPAKRGKKLLKVVDIPELRNSGSEPSGDESVDLPKPPRKHRGRGKIYKEETPEQTAARKQFNLENATMWYRDRQAIEKAHLISETKALYATLTEMKKENAYLKARSSTASMLLRDFQEVIKHEPLITAHISKAVSTSDSGVDAGMSSSSLLQRKFPTTNPFYFLTVIAILVFICTRIPSMVDPIYVFLFAEESQQQQGMQQQLEEVNDGGHEEEAAEHMEV